MKLGELQRVLAEMPAEYRDRDVVFVSKGLKKEYPVEHVLEDSYTTKENPEEVIETICLTDDTMGIELKWN